MPTVCVMGAGHAGSQFAVSLRAEGFEGRIVLVNNDIDVPYHKPPLSKKYLASEHPEITPLRAASAYSKADITWVHQPVIDIDTHAQTLRFQDESIQAYDSLVLATGAQNRRLPGTEGCINVFSLRTSADAAFLHGQLASIKAMAILGGGFIGLEVAACLASLGKSVTVIEAADRLLGRVVDPEISRRVHKTLTGMGVTVITQCADSEFVIDQNRLTAVNIPAESTAVLDSVDDVPLKGSLEVGGMLVGIGAIPDTELARAAGIECVNGVVVNASLETSVPNVYAIGDCAQFPHWQTGTNQRLESVQNAVDQAKWLAKSITGNASGDFRSVPWFWSDIGSLKLQIAGIHSGNTTTVQRTDGDAFALYHLADEKVVCVESLNSAKDHLVARKLIDAGVTVTESDIQQGPDTLKSLLN